MTESIVDSKPITGNFEIEYAHNLRGMFDLFNFWDAFG